MKNLTSRGVASQHRPVCSLIISCFLSLSFFPTLVLSSVLPSDYSEVRERKYHSHSYRPPLREKVMNDFEPSNSFETAIWRDVRALYKTPRFEEVLRQRRPVFSDEFAITPFQKDFVRLKHPSYLGDVMENFPMLMSSFSGRVRILRYLFEFYYANNKKAPFTKRVALLLKHEPQVDQNTLLAVEALLLLPVNYFSSHIRSYDFYAQRPTSVLYSKQKYQRLLWRYALRAQGVLNYLAFHKQKFFFRELNSVLPTEDRERLRIFRGEEAVSQESENSETSLSLSLRQKNREKLAAVLYFYDFFTNNWVIL